ncbi:unnamed protein product [Leptidea sinapis]|uniref:Uncharacterized protein n=1 Tax=Leptidea sinapis TaxID=189913 RepID=A0A5E4PZN6_9NEOP|nr:unnamed protein product [Leptidea sinapis]
MNRQTIKVPKYVSATQITEFPKKDQAIIIDAIENAQVKEYIVALGKLIEPTQIQFLSRISKNRICIYLTSKAIVDELVHSQKHVTIQNRQLPIHPFVKQERHVILSNVYPIIPNKVIEKKFEEIQIKLLSPISCLSAGFSEEDYSHILSFRRELCMAEEDYKRLPERISVEYEGTNYWIYISSDTATCCICNKEGYLISKCEGSYPNPDDNPQIYERSSFKRPRPPSDTTTSPVVQDKTNNDSDTTSQSNLDDVQEEKVEKKTKKHK